MHCEKVTVSAPADAIKVWNDGDSTYCLRRKPEPITNQLPPPGDSTAGKFYDCAACAGGYVIGKNTICKIKSWAVGTASEALTMEFVRKNLPSIPTPEPYCYWVDEAWNRSYLLMQRAPGQSLENAWKRLTEGQKKRIAAELASHVKTLAQFKSPRLESVDGHGLAEVHLLHGVEGHDTSLPHWTPEIHPTFTPAQLRSYLLRKDGVEAPSIGEEFYLYHNDLGPTNFFVVDPIPDEENGLPLLSTIIDWEGAGYFPLWWIGTKPFASAGFGLDWKEHARPEAWVMNFTDALRQNGFDHELEWYVPHRDLARARRRIERKRRDRDMGFEVSD